MSISHPQGGSTLGSCSKSLIWRQMRRPQGRLCQLLVEQLRCTRSKHAVYENLLLSSPTGQANQSPPGRLKGQVCPLDVWVSKRRRRGSHLGCVPGWRVAMRTSSSLALRGQLLASGHIESCAGLQVASFLSPGLGFPTHQHLQQAG